MKEDAIERLRVAGPQALAGTTVSFAYLFGSVALGRARADSDVDVAVFVGPGESRPSEYVALDLAGRLAEASAVGGIEVVVLNDAPLPLKGRAIQERVVIYSRDEPARVRFESETLRLFFDFQHHARALDEDFLEETAAGRR